MSLTNHSGSNDDLLRYRSEFPILDRTTYLISNSLGAMPRGVYDAMKAYADIWATARCPRMGGALVDACFRSRR